MLISELGLVPCFLTDFAALVMRQTCLYVITEKLESLEILVATIMMLESGAKV